MAFDLNNLQYLALEGGGGRGILYVKPIDVLEASLRDMVKSKYLKNYPAIATYRKDVVQALAPEPVGGGSGEEPGETDDVPHPLDPKNGFLLPTVNVNGNFPLIQITIPPQYRVIKGISGSSAGAITAFMLSLGMSSEDIEHEMQREIPITVPLEDFNGPISVFEQFIDEDSNLQYKRLQYKRIVDGEVSTGYYPVVDLEDLKKKLVWRILEPILLPVATFAKVGSYKILKAKYWDGSPFGVSAKIFEGPYKFQDFMGNAIPGRGIFSALKARDYFAELIETYLYPTLKQIDYPTPTKPAGELTFTEFYNLTGVDLVLTGTNITQRAPRYFSVYHTPDFPVVEAVQISMNLPFAFKPIYVNTEVRSGDEDQKNRYAGLYVDGGMLNNYPIHAFDKIEISKNTKDLKGQHLKILTYQGVTGAFPIAGDPQLRGADCDCVLGMRLQEKETTDYNTRENDIYPKHGGVLIDFLKDLFNTSQYGSEEGQIRTIDEEGRSVKFYATVEGEVVNTLKKRNYNVDDNANSYTLSIDDFSTPTLDRIRNRIELAKIKESLMENARRNMESFLNNSK